jgi:hypothetical protein
VPDDADDVTPATVPAEALAPLDVDGVGAITYGTIAWTVALVACLLAREPLASAGRTWWIWVCVAGALLGIPGLWYVRRRRAAYRAAAREATAS